MVDKLKHLESTRRRLWLAALAIVVLMPAIGMGFRGVERATQKPTVEQTSLPSLSEKPSIAVLPFANRSSDKQDTRFFSEGIHDDLLTALVKIRDLRVISRTSVMGYRNTSKTIRKIAGELGVTTILEGSVQRAGNRVRINAQLVDAGTDIHLWAESFDSELTVQNIFAIQSEIAQEIAHALKAELTSEDKEFIEKRPTENLEAFDFYLRGWEHFRRPGDNTEDLLNAQRMYERAVEIDPEFALAYARLSETHSYLHTHYDHSDERLDKVREHAERAVELDPDLPEGLSALAWYYVDALHDNERALVEIAKAERVSPRNVELLEDRAWILGIQGKWEEALPAFQMAVALDPRNPALLWNFGEVNLFLHRYKEAEKYTNKALELNPHSYSAGLQKSSIPLYRNGDTGTLRSFLKSRPFEEADVGFWLWQLELWDRDYRAALEILSRIEQDYWMSNTRFYPKPLLQGYVHHCDEDKDQARAAFESARAMLEPRLPKQSKDPWIHSALGLTYAGLGQKEEAIREGRLAADLMPISKRAILGPAYVWELAIIYTLIDEFDTAIDHFDLCLSKPWTNTIEILLIDPRIDPLRALPRFHALVEKYRERAENGFQH